MTLFLRADHATASETLRPESPELQDRDRPTDSAQILLVSAARFYIKKGHTAGMPCRNAFRRPYSAMLYLAADPRL
jgi:hypothetical protein